MIKSQRKNKRKGEALIKKAIDYHIRGDLLDAEEAYREALDCGISDVAIFSNLGIICQATQRTDEAIEHYKKAIAIKPDHPDPYTNLGSLFKDLGNLDQALTSTLKSLQLNPNNHDAHMNLGIIFKDLGNLDQALTSTLKSLQLNPNNHDAHMNLGIIYKDLGNLDEALASTLQSLELKPDNPNAHMNLGGIYKDLGNLDEALASTLKALSLKPDNADAHMNLGSIYLCLEKIDKSLRSTLKSLELNPTNNNSLYNLSYIKLLFGELDEAEASISQAIKRNPKEAKYFLLLGVILCAKGDTDRAIKCHRIALSSGTLSKGDEFFAFILHAYSQPTENKNQANTANKNIDLPIILRRSVEPKLIKMIYQLNALDLNKLQDPTYGKARGSNYNFFKDHGKQFQHLEKDLISCASLALGSEIYIHESFYTILNGNSVVKKHNHISFLDKNKSLSIGKKKFALVYYLKVGTQSCSEPGFLKFYNPENEVLPFEGMVIIFPGSMYHSATYNGDKDRIIIGVNFYVKDSSRLK